jgi:hypothetical protein
VTNKRALVQVKSRADLEAFQFYKSEFEKMGQFDEMYFVVHSPSVDLAQHNAEPPVTLLTAGTLAKLVVSAGLVEWLIQKLQ